MVTLKLYLKQKLFGLKMQEGSDLPGHINVFNQLVADLMKVDVKIDDEDRAIILLCSLPRSYEYLVTILTYGKEDIKVEDIVRCYKCKDCGHVKRDCPELKKDGGSISVVIAKKKKDDSDSDGDILTVSSEKSCEAWLLYSVSLFHATSNKELFSSYTKKENGFAYLGDGSGYLAVGVGDIKFKMYDGEEILLKGVKHVPGLTRNLI